MFVSIEFKHFSRHNQDVYTYNMVDSEFGDTEIVGTGYADCLTRIYGEKDIDVLPNLIRMLIYIRNTWGHSIHDQIVAIDKSNPNTLAPYKEALTKLLMLI